MAVQAKIDLLGSVPITHGAAFAAVTIDEGDRPDPGPGDAAHSRQTAVVLPILRLIAAAYATGEAECWEAAFRVAEHEIGADRGALLVGRMAGLVRIMRRCRNVVCRPASCRGLSADEHCVLAMLAAARDGDRSKVASAAATYGCADIDELTRAAKVVIEAGSS